MCPFWAQQLPFRIERFRIFLINRDLHLTWRWARDQEILLTDATDAMTTGDLDAAVGVSSHHCSAALISVF